MTRRHAGRWIGALAVGLGALPAAHAAPAAALAGPADRLDKAVIVFRYDDVGSYTSENYTHVFAIDRAVFAAFAEFELPFVAGVIPCFAAGPSTPAIPEHGWLGENREYFDWLAACARTQRVEIALHGLTHKSSFSEVADEKNEFAGLDLEVQRARIIAGKQHLEKLFNCTVETFAPPWNSYDENTLRVLSELKFDSISDDWRRPGHVGDIARISQTADLDDLPEILDRHDRIPPGSLIVVLFHGYNLTLDDREVPGMTTLGQFRQLLRRVAGRSDLVCMTIEDFSHQWQAHYTERWHRTAERHVALTSMFRGLPGLDTLVRNGRPGILYPESDYVAGNTWIVLLGIAVACSALLLGWLLGRGARRMLLATHVTRPRRKLHVLGTLAAGAGVLMLLFRLVSGQTLGARVVMCFLCVAAFCASLWLPSRRFRRAHAGARSGAEEAVPARRVAVGPALEP